MKMLIFAGALGLLGSYVRRKGLIMVSLPSLLILGTCITRVLYTDGLTVSEF